jgi:two-component system, NtrC family, sensor kinase
VLIFRDITDRKRLEQRVAAAERLASISTLAAGMALELENPLTATLGNVDFALRRLAELGRDLARGDSQVLAPALAEITAALNDAQQAGKRLRHTVRDLKKFPRARELRKEIVDLPSSIDAALLLTQPLVKPNTNVSKVLGTTPYVEANEGQLVQVFVNLIANAIQAGGDRPGHAVVIRTSTDPLGRAVVEVRDTGRGIAPEDLPRIFDPFFSVRPASDALGLGLSICQRIVTDAGGEMSVESQVGFGATFRVILPEAAGSSQPPSSETFSR